MTKLAIIGGTGFNQIDSMEIYEAKPMENIYGSPSADLIFGKLADTEIVYLARHGTPHAIPPHIINYRANIWALKECGVDTILGINAVGGITPEMKPTRLVIPEQIIDYTWGREHTYSDNNTNSLQHIDFTKPYSDYLRNVIISIARDNLIDCHDGGTYGATQGPRLETAAEILRLQRDGCDIVGMTGMPEAALAKELDIEYGSISMVVNDAAGKSEVMISMDNIEKNAQLCLTRLNTLLGLLLPRLD